MFKVDVHREDDGARVALAGELDLATTAEVDTQLNALVDAGVRRLVIDLSGLTFMSSSGVHLVIEWTERARAEGIELTIVPGPPLVQRVFEIAGLDGRLPFADVAPA